MLEIEVVAYTRFEPGARPKAKSESQFASILMKSHWWAAATTWHRITGDKKGTEDPQPQLEPEPVLKMNPRCQCWIVVGAGVKSSGRRISMDDSKQQKWRAKNIASSVNQWQHTHTHSRRRQTHTDAHPHICDADCWKLIDLCCNIQKVSHKDAAESRQRPNPVTLPRVPSPW